MTTLLASDILFFGLLGYIGLGVFLAVSLSETRRYRQLWAAELEVSNYLFRKMHRAQQTKPPAGNVVPLRRAVPAGTRVAYDIDPQT